MIDNKEAIAKLKAVDKPAATTAQKLNTIANKGLKIGAAILGGATVAVGGLKKLASNAASATDRVDKLSQRLGLSREGFQEWDFVMSQAGVSIDTVQSGMKNLSQRMQDAIDGAGTGKQLFDELGVTITESMSQEDAFNATITALQNMEDGVRKADLAQQLFGRTGQNLLPLLNSTAESTEALKQKARELGLVLDDKTIDAGVQLTDTMDQAGRSLSAVGVGLGTTVMPMVQSVLDWFILHMPEIKAVVEKAMNAVATVIGWVKDNANWLIPVLGGLLGALIAMKVIATVTTLWEAYTKSKIAATIAEKGFSAALRANPIGLIITAIGALIAIIIILVKNWDKIKEAVQGAWDKLVEVWGNIKGWFNENIVQPIKDAIEKIKGFFKFKWSLPKIKLPHFKVTWTTEGFWGKVGDFLGLPGRPKIGVDWYAQGAIFDKPTIFATPYGLKGVGEAGKEVVAPLSDLKKYFPQQQDINLTLPIYINGKFQGEYTITSEEIARANKNRALALGVNI